MGAEDWVEGRREWGGGEGRGDEVEVERVEGWKK